MTKPTVLLPLLVACGEPPLGTFTVDCTDATCTEVRFVADDSGVTTIFAWQVDGQRVDTGRELVRDLDLQRAELVRLEATSPGGTSGSQLWVAGNPALTQDAAGVFVQEAVGLLTVGGDRTVDIECGPFAIVNSIGGCFTGTQPVTIHQSVPSLDTVPPSLLDPASYGAPAEFVPADTVGRGDFEGARAVFPDGPVEDAWPGLPSMSSALPRFEAVFVPPTTGEGTWIVTTAQERPRTLHRQALFVTCDADSLDVDSVRIDDETLADWSGAE
ncbi:MAG: hypothetical protein AAF602_27520 [Myxococcota bacterium]